MQTFNRFGGKPFDTAYRAQLFTCLYRAVPKSFMEAVPKGFGGCLVLDRACRHWGLKSLEDLHFSTNRAFYPGLWCTNYCWAAFSRRNYRLNKGMGGWIHNIGTGVTLRKLPINLEKQIRRLAAENNASINRTIIRLLQKALGITPDERKQRDSRDLAGIWSDDEAREFEENISIFDKIDNEIWEK